MIYVPNLLNTVLVVLEYLQILLEMSSFQFNA
jgi:hypothetical protein